jgi:hypothetical protein
MCIDLGMPCLLTRTATDRMCWAQRCAVSSLLNNKRYPREKPIYVSFQLIVKTNGKKRKLRKVITKTLSKNVAKNSKAWEKTFIKEKNSARAKIVRNANISSKLSKAIKII